MTKSVVVVHDDPVFIEGVVEALGSVAKVVEIQSGVISGL